MKICVAPLTVLALGP